MGKKISNPPPPDNVARPAPPPNPPRPPSWQDDVDEVRRLRDALEQKQVTIDDLIESLDEAKYSEPELRAKLDKQRQRIKQLKKEIDDFADYRALKRGQIARLQSQLADVASYESAALRKRIEQLEALANDAEDILSQGAGQLDHDIHEWRRQYRGLLPAGDPSDDDDQAAHDASELFEDINKGFEGSQTVPDPEPE